MRAWGAEPGELWLRGAAYGTRSVGGADQGQWARLAAGLQHSDRCWSDVPDLAYGGRGGPRRRARSALRGYSGSGLAFVTEGVGDGLLQRHRLPLCPGCCKGRFVDLGADGGEVVLIVGT